MTREEISLSQHKMKLDSELHDRDGLSFQNLFEQIMRKSDSSFLTVRPMGRAGDWKADGFSLNSGTVYQCYAPGKMKGAEAAKKIIEDFDGARNHWQEKMLAWVFAIFEAWVKRRESPNTQRAYREDIMAFITWMGWTWPRDSMALLGVTVSDVCGAPVLRKNFRIARSRAASTESPCAMFISCLARPAVIAFVSSRGSVEPRPMN